ncbi:MAG: hypothetical protein CL935_02055 [Deltaproteobacteria bacterium]|nr:hypothetical protein [Deltaproteobacteria bacterium]|tara:strand:- start:2064 stop:2567 length:504 start_codon:yes stop_codon:yes gene_type:complete
MRYFLITCIIFCNLSVIAVADQNKEQVLKLLEGRHWKLDIRAFNKLGDNTDLILIEIAKNDLLMNVLRFRALEVLSLFPTDRTADFLEYTAEKAFTPMARRGFQAMKRSFAKTKPERVKLLATKLLKHKNANIRISAAKYIRSKDQTLFRNYIKTEKENWVKKEVQK